MCGIIGYTGGNRARNVLIDGLKVLEYRGYDSAGVALEFENGLEVYKCGGRVSDLDKMTPPSNSNTGIGHTRWATHGKANAVNSHPHFSPDGQFAIVHNGVIENCTELKAEITAAGGRFASDTDSEIIAHLIMLEYNKCRDVEQSVEKTASRLEGAATFLVLHAGEDKIYCRRGGAALLIGYGENENFVASDALALTKYTNRIAVLKDGDTAVISPDGVTVKNNGKAVLRGISSSGRTQPTEEKCYMRREIDDIPSALQSTYRSFICSFDKKCTTDIQTAKRIALFACVTAYHAALYGKEMFEKKAHKPCEVYVASEHNSARFVDDTYFAIFISQSGETADTLSALEYCKDRGCKTLAVTNVADSTITFKADYTFLLNAGAELAVAATKSYNCQLLALYLTALEVSGQTVPQELVDTLSSAAKDLTEKEVNVPGASEKKLFFVGKGEDGITALEGALKFKEITYKMTDAYPAGELKHGSIALVDEGAAVVAIATSAAEKKRMAASISELKARGARVTAVSSVGDIGADETEVLPPLPDEDLYPILSVIPLQLLSLNVSRSLGINPDKPRNLAKSVTVI